MNDVRSAAIDEGADSTYSVRTEISREMVRLYKSQFGRGPSEEQFCEVIERVVGRKVRAFISGLDTDRDVAAELFYLEN